MNCGKCGKKVRADDSFCRSCGEQIETKPRKESNVRRNIEIASFAFLILALAVILKNDRDRQNPTTNNGNPFGIRQANAGSAGKQQNLSRSYLDVLNQSQAGSSRAKSVGIIQNAMISEDSPEGSFRKMWSYCRAGQWDYASNYMSDFCQEVFADGKNPPMKCIYDALGGEPIIKNVRVDKNTGDATITAYCSKAKKNYYFCMRDKGDHWIVTFW